jgi:3-hydroxyacyl-[acyl-carrier-protein] dehydratase
MPMDVNEVRQYLPHRYPFLLVDRVEELVEGQYIVATKNVSINEPFFNGHFPQMPVMPGVLIVEAMAQAAGILGFKTVGKTPEDGSIYLFAGVDGVKFKRQVVPGDQLTLKVDYVSDRRNIWKFEGKAYVGDELAATASITCVDKEL